MFHQTQKKWLTAQPLAASLWALQRQLDRFASYYNFIKKSAIRLSPVHSVHGPCVWARDSAGIPQDVR
jgi:hypothetical protein